MHPLCEVTWTESIPGPGWVRGMFVRADGTRLLTTPTTLMQLPPSGMLATIAGDPEENEGFQDGEGIGARFNLPDAFTVDRGGNIVLADCDNHALRKVSKAGAAVSTLAGNGEAGFVDGRGDAARFDQPSGLNVYKAHALGLGRGGGTPLCPFDCDCCF